MEKISKKDFIELEFTGRVKGGDIFDSNIKQDLQKANLNLEPKPFVFCVGEKMFLEAIDDFLIGKEIGKQYELELEPEKAFGKRNPSLIKIIPLRLFKQQQTMPQPGMVFNFDVQIGKVISVSGGRVITDFNNPLAGKTVIYKLRINRKITDKNEKAKALIEFFTKKEFKFEIKDKKLIIYTDKKFGEFLNLFKDKFKEILGLELNIKEEKTTNKENTKISTQKHSK